MLAMLCKLTGSLLCLCSLGGFTWYDAWLAVLDI